MTMLHVISMQKGTVAPSSIYVFGERNSGTNYVHNLIVRNCVVAATLRRPYAAGNKNAYGWKHGFPQVVSAPADVLAITVVREPIAWLHSLCRVPWHAAPHLRGIPFSEFIRREWVSVIDEGSFGVNPDGIDWGQELMLDRAPVTGARFPNPLALRNAKNRGFASLDAQFGNCLRVSYEMVVANPQGFLNALCRAYGFVRLRAYDPIVYDRGTPARGVFTPKPMQPLDVRDMDFIMAGLDLDQEAKLGYHFVHLRDAGLRRHA